MERGTLSVRARVGPTIDGLEGVKVKYVWKRHDEMLGTRKTYAVHKLDLGVALSCTAVAVDTFGRSSDAATVHTQPVAPGAPMVEQVCAHACLHGAMMEVSVGEEEPGAAAEVPG